MLRSNEELSNSGKPRYKNIHYSCWVGPLFVLRTAVILHRFSKVLKACLRLSILK